MKTRALKIVVSAVLIFTMIMSIASAATITKTKFNSGTGEMTIDYYVAGEEAIIYVYDAEDETNLLYFNQQPSEGTGSFTFTLPEDYQGETVKVKVGGTNEASSTVFVSVTPTPAPTPDPESAEVGGIYNYIATEPFDADTITMDKTNQVIYSDSDFDIVASESIYKGLRINPDCFNLMAGKMQIAAKSAIAVDDVLIKFAPISEGKTKITFDAKVTANGSTWDKHSYFGAVVNSSINVGSENTKTEDAKGIAVGIDRVKTLNANYVMYPSTSVGGIVRYDSTLDENGKLTSYNIIGNDSATHTYQYIIDMDTKEYELSIDGQVIGTYDLHDQNLESFDALRFRGNYYGDAYHNGVEYEVDNISVKTTQKIDVKNIKFYNENGSKLVRDMKIRPGKNVVLPKAPVKRGATFTSWRTEPNGGGEAVDFSNLTGSMSVYAGYTAKPNITYMSGGQVYQEVAVDYGADVTAPVLENRDEYLFIGWFEADGTMADFSNVTSDMTVYAKFGKVAARYSESFDDETAIDYNNKTISESDFAWVVNDETYGQRNDNTKILSTAAIAGYDGTTSNALYVNPFTTVVEKIDMTFPKISTGITDITFDLKLNDGYSSSPTMKFGELTDTSSNKRINAMTPYSPTYNKPLGTKAGFIRYDAATETATGIQNTTWVYKNYNLLYEKNDTNWHRFNIKVDMTGKTYTLFVDGEKIGVYSFYDSALTGFNAIRFAGNEAGAPHNKTRYYIDNISVVNYMIEGEEPNEYTVTFYDEDGTTVLGTDKVLEGEDAVYTGTTPTKQSTAQYSYTFEKWDKDLTNIKADTQVKAVYKSNLRYYTVTFVNYDGSTISTQSIGYGYGAVAPANPSRESDGEYTYTFDKWDKAFNNITGDLKVTAQYKATAIGGEDDFVYIIWGDLDGNDTVNQSDANEIKKAVRGNKKVTVGGYIIGETIPGTEIIWGDIDGNGTVNQSDANEIQKAVKSNKKITSGGYILGQTAKIPKKK